MSTRDVYTEAPAQQDWDVPMAGQAHGEQGVLDCGQADLEALMRTDEQIAETLDAERFAAEEAARAGEVAQVIADGATS